MLGFIVGFAMAQEVSKHVQTHKWWLFCGFFGMLQLSGWWLRIYQRCYMIHLGRFLIFPRVTQISGAEAVDKQTRML